jgi:hypothetical protein
MKEILVVVLLVALLFLCICREGGRPPANAIFVIYPYRDEGTWVFDAQRLGLVKEPFVAGIPEIIDQLVLLENIPQPEKGFRLLFSQVPFPGYTLKLTWLREEAGGHWYWVEKFKAEGWLCPALFKYFKKAPKEIYVKAEKKQ